jgi:hypothetical protein
MNLRHELQQGRYHIEALPGNKTTVLSLFLIFFGPWVLMLAYGVIRIKFFSQLPTLSYFEVLLLVGALIICLWLVRLASDRLGVDGDIEIIARSEQ